MPFLPTTRSEMDARGWGELDVLLITGDAYVDHPSFGVAVVGRVLEADGYRVGVVAQPDWRDPASIGGMGRPRLFCGVTAGNLDSMLANYTAARRRRRDDAYSEGGCVDKRPNHATVVYAQMARRAFPGLPIVLGGIEASLRRVAHYDYWQDKLRPSILLDSKADLLVYGMGEQTVREIARRLAAGDTDLGGIRGTCRLLGATASTSVDRSACVVLPSFEECRQTTSALLTLTKLVEREQNPFCGSRCVQFHGDRALVVDPPPEPLDTARLDCIYALPFMREPHGIYREAIPAFEMIKDSVTVVRGCAGGCSFCGLGLHQGKFVVSRSEASVLAEVGRLVDGPRFRGTVSDLGGPTANLYGCVNGNDAACLTCRRPSCFFPEICARFKIEGRAGTQLLERVAALAGVKHVFVNSGIRMDVALRTPQYLRRLIRHHVSGHLKVAPEHLHPDVLRRMRKPRGDVFDEFRRVFEAESREAGKQQYLVPYFISNFPGCTDREMATVEEYLERHRWNLQQVQDFIPLPMTPAAAMYYTALDYGTEKPIPIVRGLAARRKQMTQLRGPQQRDGRRRRR